MSVGQLPHTTTKQGLAEIYTSTNCGKVQCEVPSWSFLKHYLLFTRRIIWGGQRYPKKLHILCALWRRVRFSHIDSLIRRRTDHVERYGISIWKLCGSPSHPQFDGPRFGLHCSLCSRWHWFSILVSWSSYFHGAARVDKKNKAWCFRTFRIDVYYLEGLP